MRAVPDDRKFVIANQESHEADLICPNPRGWYCSVANVVAAPTGLVAVYRLSDSHSAVYTHIVVAYSDDGGRSWHGRRSISQRNVWEQQSVWIAPQLSRLRDGRLVIICDQGHRTSKDRCPRLALWQQPALRMANYLFWSDDHGKSWSQPVQCDIVGGEPGYIVDLSDGTLVYTRTETLETDAFESPPPPGHSIYHRNTAVFSDDRGAENQVFFSLYPALTSRARVEMEAELRLADQSSEGCDLFAGCLVPLTPQGVSLTDSGENDSSFDDKVSAQRHAKESASVFATPVFQLDTTQWHRYRIVRAEGEISIYVDGRLRLKESAPNVACRLVRFGSKLRGVSHWRAVSVSVENPQDYSIDWRWRADSGAYPDQFRRARMVRLDATSDSGYSNWDRMEDGTIVIADYTNDEFSDAASMSGKQPIIKAYIITEEELT